MIEVITIDVCKDGDCRRQEQQRPVRFIRFDDYVFSAAEPCIGSKRRYTAADNNGRIEVRSRHHVSDHRGSRSLSVSACHRDPVPVQAHQFSKHLRAGYYRNLALPRRRRFRIVLANRRRDYDHIGSGYILALMAFEHSGPQGFQPACYLRPFEIGTAYYEVLSQRQQDLGDTAHADAADPHKMNMSDSSKHHDSNLLTHRQDRRRGWRRRACPAYGWLLPFRSPASDRQSTLLIRLPDAPASAPFEESFGPLPPR